MPVQITNATLAKAARDAAEGQDYDITDARSRGLILRVGKRGCRWAFRRWVDGETWRVDFGTVDEIPLHVAREMANKAWSDSSHLGHRFAPGYRFGLRQRFLSTPKAPMYQPAMLERVEAAKFWRFDEARERYLAHVEATLAPATLIDYRKMLRQPELAPLKTRPVKTVKRVELAGILRDIHESGRERHAGHLASVLRPFFAWLGEDHQVAQSGVEPGVMERLRAPRRSTAPKPSKAGKIPGKYVPPPAEMGQIVATVRSGVFDPTVTTAFELLLRTVQRRRVVVSALKADFVPWSEEPGWGVWSMGPSHRKTATKRGDKGQHAIPLPPDLWLSIQEQMARSPGPWLFPQVRPRRAGEPADGHLSPGTFNHRLADMGVKTSPHDLRRALSTHGQKLLRIRRADIKAVLDHNEGIPTNDVLEAHYTDDDRLDEKQPVILKWSAWLNEQAAAARVGDVESLARQLTDARKKVVKPARRKAA